MKIPGNSVTETIKRFRSFRYALILEGVMTGAAVGLVIVMFRLSLEKAEVIRQLVFSWIQARHGLIPIWFALFAAAAMLITLLLKWEPLISGSGIPQLKGEMQSQMDQKWWRVLIAKFVGGILSIGCGLSLGREGPSIQLGAMVAKGFAKITHRIKTEEKLLLSCGASAGLAAAFNAPIAGILFSLEEIHKGFTPEVLLSSMAASITADFISRNVFGLSPVFSFQIIKMLPLTQYAYVAVLGVLLGLFGVLYNTSIKKSQELYQKISNQTLRMLIPFLAAAALAFFYPQILGGGHSLVEGISSGTMLLKALCLLLSSKFIFSMISFGSGAPGGIFLPLLVMGALIGAVYQGAAVSIFNVSDEWLGNCIILGMAGCFSAIVRAPMTGILLISEMTGSFSHLLTISLVSLLAYLVPDLLKCPPVYDQLLRRMLLSHPLKRISHTATGEKVLVDGRVAHGAAAVGHKISNILWPETCLVVSLMRGEEEFIPKGDTVIQAGDQIVLLCDESAAQLAHQTLEENCTHIPVGKTV